jgi:hypothetical protein
MDAGAGATAGGAGTENVPRCQQAEEDYVWTSTEECLALTFRCDPGAAAFADACGCGCDNTPFAESDGTPFGDVTLDCGGLSGVFATFEFTPERLVIGETDVFAWVERPGRPPATALWAIDKQTGDVRLLPPGAEPEPMPGAVVSGPRSFQSNGVRYWYDEPTLFADTGNGNVPLFDISCSIPALIIIDSELYLTCEDGALKRGFVAPLVAPTVVDQRGSMDDDDYGLILGADAEAVYWLGGPYSDAGVYDQDPLVLYRYCR